MAEEMREEAMGRRMTNSKVGLYIMFGNSNLVQLPKAKW